MRLSRVMRMKSRVEFSRVREQGVSFGGRYLVLGYLPEPDLNTDFKFGIILTRKVGNAVSRNRIRRRVRAIIGELGERVAQSGYLVMIARKQASLASFEELSDDLKKLARKAGILSDINPR
jgi:ribonuclease P protein component